MKNKFAWAARILTIVYIAFIALFALDVFNGEPSFLAIIMHLIPSIVLLIILILSWKKPKIGGWTFIILGVAFTIYFNTYRQWQTFLLISLPLFLVGILFFLSTKSKK